MTVGAREGTEHAASTAAPWTVVVAAGRPKGSPLDRPVRLGRVVAAVVAASLVVLTVIAVLGSVVARRISEEQGVHDAAKTTDLLATSVVTPQLTDAMLADAAIARRVFAPFANALTSDPVLRVKIWTSSGRILWSDESRLDGRTFTLDDEAVKALTGARIVAAVSDLARPENVYERSADRLLEVYRPIWTPRGEPLLLEVYYRYDAVAERSTQLWHGFVGILISSLLGLLLLLTPIVWGLASRARRAQEQREILLRRATDVSLAERRRIAGALHDGLVQELAAASYSVSAHAQAAAARGDDGAAQALRDTATTVRSGIGGLRALLVDLYPPNLRAAGLAAALRDVAATVALRGVAVDFEVDPAAVDVLDDEQQEAVFRVGQECLRNAERHARPEHVRLALSLEDNLVRLDVEDDGVGMSLADATREDSFGRRLMADQAERVGASLAVRTAPGAGTAFRMEVPRS